MKNMLLCILILLPQICSASVYMHVDSNGNVIYTDAPTDSNSAKVALPKTSVAPSISGNQTPASTGTQGNKEPATQSAANDLANIRKPYTKLKIETPANGDTIQNQPVLTVTLSIEPKLQTGDAIQVYLDGNPWGKPLPGTQFVLPIPERGTHEIAAKVFDKNNKPLLSSDSYTIYVQQAHLGNSG